MTQFDPAVQSAFNRAVRQVYADRALLLATPCSPGRVTQEQCEVRWSWLEITGPHSGAMALVQVADLAREVAGPACVGGGPSSEADRDLEAMETARHQCALTTAIAEQALRELCAGQGDVCLGAPCTGTDAPDVRDGNWSGLTFAIGEWWAAVFVKCPGLADRPAVRRKDSDTRRLGPSEAPDLDVSIDDSALEAKRADQEVPAALPVARAHLPSAPARPGRQGPPESPKPVAPPATRTSTSSRIVLPAGPPPLPTASPADTRARMRSANRGTVSTPGPGPEILPDAPAAMPVAPGAIAIGDRIGHYDVLARLGSGSRAVVLQARHRALARLVALKVVRPELAGDAAFTATFLAQARQAATLEHPHLVTVYDAAHESGHLYVALRYLAGGDLQTLIRRSGALDPARATAICAACLEALALVHSRGLAHGGIRPAHILLEEDGVPRLAEIGVPHQGEGAPAPGFIAPELQSGGRPDARSDFYALGATLYHALSARPPFPGGGYDANVSQVLAGLPAGLRSNAHDHAEALARVVATAMCKDPGARYGSAQDFRSAVLAAATAVRNEVGSAALTWFGRLFSPPPPTH